MRKRELLGAGRSADVYALDEKWVLRRYRDGMDATHEWMVMSYLGAHGYPVPRLGPRDSKTPPCDLVLQRLTGPTMLESLMTGELSSADAAAMLAGLLAELHTVPARLSPHPEDRILHLDLHPDNVMLTDRGPVVIDWSNTREGVPAADRAMSSLILAQAAVDPRHPESAGARSLLNALLPHFAASGGIPAHHLAEAASHRAANPTMSPHEVALIDRATSLITELTT
ncbi:aminoglycoside phosphotransferase family protein [Streptomyces sp. NBC_01591]|uniref:phosphotransferase n=1 Tax=Streptomyces sp. NBC_01591 TaxID=2975888 RepID=UPI002DD8FCDC|nr:phosphotransferase [Streptomyces sp. NBC_01591]WSD69240.1 aminoglycoside phosphotransferase family protein [Streptomyces sp. NBC_01591]